MKELKKQIKKQHSQYLEKKKNVNSKTLNPNKDIHITFSKKQNAVERKIDLEIKEYLQQGTKAGYSKALTLQKARNSYIDFVSKIASNEKVANLRIVNFNSFKEGTTTLKNQFIDSSKSVFENLLNLGIVKTERNYRKRQAQIYKQAKQKIPSIFKYGKFTQYVIDNDFFKRFNYLNINKIENKDNMYFDLKQSLSNVDLKVNYQIKNNKGKIIRVKKSKKQKRERLLNKSQFKNNGNVYKTKAEVVANFEDSNYKKLSEIYGFNSSMLGGFDADLEFASGGVLIQATEYADFDEIRFLNALRKDKSLRSLFKMLNNSYITDSVKLGQGQIHYEVGYERQNNILQEALKKLDKVMEIIWKEYPNNE